MRYNNKFEHLSGHSSDHYCCRVTSLDLKHCNYVMAYVKN